MLYTNVRTMLCFSDFISIDGFGILGFNRLEKGYLDKGKKLRNTAFSLRE